MKRLSTRLIRLTTALGILATLGVAACDIDADHGADDAADTLDDDGVDVADATADATMNAGGQRHRALPTQASPRTDSTAALADSPAASKRLAFITGLSKLLPSPSSTQPAEVTPPATDAVPTGGFDIASISRPAVGMSGTSFGTFAFTGPPTSKTAGADTAPPPVETATDDPHLGDGQEGCPAVPEQPMAMASDLLDLERQFPMFRGRIVMAVDPADELFHAGHEPAHNAQNFAVRRHVRERLLPRSVSDWRASEVIGYGPEGEVCRGWISSFEGGSFYTEHPWDWSEEPQAAKPIKVPSPSKAWDRGKRYLLGDLVVTSGDCTKALYAVHVEAPARVPYEPVALSKTLRAHALVAFTGTADWAEVQKNHEQMMADAFPKAPVKRWDSKHSAAYYEDGPVHRVQAYLDAATKRRFVVVSSHTGGECGEPGGSLSSVFVVTHSKAGTSLKPVYGLSYEGTVSGLVDLNRDGTPDAVLPWGDRGVLMGGRDGGDSRNSETTGTTLLERATAPDIHDTGCRC